MTKVRYPRRSQSGAYLLEALIGILIFSFGILGIVGLQAQSIRFTNDSEYRAEAVYLANALISKMWADDRTQLKAKYDSTVGGSGYLDFKDQVHAAFAGADVQDPDVKVDDAGLSWAAPSTTSSIVQVKVFWQLPGEPLMHNYTTIGVVGQN